MAVPRSGLHEVLTGWTGTITITVGAVDAITTPRQRESAVSLMLRAFARATQIHGTGWTIEDDGSGAWDLSFTSTFSLTATLVTETRLAFGGLSGSSSYSSAGDFEGDYWPTHGMAISGLEGAQTQGLVTASGSDAFSGMLTATPLTVTAWDTFAGSYNLVEDISGVYDLWLSGQRRYTRLHIPSWTRRDVGRTQTLMVCESSALAVA